MPIDRHEFSTKIEVEQIIDAFLARQNEQERMQVDQQPPTISSAQDIEAMNAQIWPSHWDKAEHENGFFINLRFAINFCFVDCIQPVFREELLRASDRK